MAAAIAGGVGGSAASTAWLLGRRRVGGGVDDAAAGSALLPPHELFFFRGGLGELFGEPPVGVLLGGRRSAAEVLLLRCADDGERGLLGERAVLRASGELVGELGTSFLCLSASTRSPSLGDPDGEISSGGTLRPAVGEGLPSVQTARLTIGEA